MEESPLEAQKREEILRMYHSCKEALRIINDVNMSTITTDIPPSVVNDWRFVFFQIRKILKNFFSNNSSPVNPRPAPAPPGNPGGVRQAPMPPGMQGGPAGGMPPMGARPMGPGGPGAMPIQNRPLPGPPGQQAPMPPM